MTDNQKPSVRYKTSTDHMPVMLDAVLEMLQLSPGSQVVDATLGGGGYTRALLRVVGPTGRVIALDWDQSAIDRFRTQAEQDSILRAALENKRLILIRSSYADLAHILAELGISRVDGLAADLGLSSDQLADSSRGLSFQSTGPLDMRLNSDETVRASQLLKEWDATALADLFRIYGDEPEADRIAAAVVEYRKQMTLTTTTELRELIWENVVPARRKMRIHPATKVFQALRIAVNSEHQHLERFLALISQVLAPGARAAIVSFHSGEDALIKKMLNQVIQSETSRLRWVSKKPRVPSDEEIQRNPRARSAKLRVIEKTENKK